LANRIDFFSHKNEEEEIQLCFIYKRQNEISKLHK